jgi:hypothetical protein
VPKASLNIWSASGKSFSLSGRIEIFILHYSTPGKKIISLLGYPSIARKIRTIYV